MKYSALMAVHRALDVRRLLPAGAHGVGRRRLHERRVERQGRRSRRSTSRAARSCTCPRAGRRSCSASSSASARASGKRAFLPAQPGAHHGRHRHAVGRLVRLQRRQRGRRRRHRRQRLHRRPRSRPRSRRAVWPALEWITRGKPTVLGFCSGAVAGLVVITPAAGFVIADRRGHHRRARRRGPVPRLHQAQERSSSTTTRSTPSACTASAARWARFVTGFFATPDVNANLNTNLAAYRRQDAVARAAQGHRLHAGARRSSARSCSPTSIKAVIGLRPDARTKRSRASTTTDHGEAGYHYEEAGG